jgi:hypothetical protein
MFRRELWILGGLSGAIFFSVMAAGWWSARELHETSRMLAVDTLPGLADTGLASERINDNRRMMREMLLPHTTAEREQMIARVRANSTQDLWKDYATSIFEPADRQNYSSMLIVRSNYLQECDQYFKLVSADKMDEASVFFNGGLTQNFRDYSQSVHNLFEYNVQQGGSRAQKILSSFQYAPLAEAGVSVLAFLFGLILGLRFILSGPAKKTPPHSRI